MFLFAPHHPNQTWLATPPHTSATSLLWRLHCIMCCWLLGTRKVGPSTRVPKHGISIMLRSKSTPSRSCWNSRAELHFTGQYFTCLVISATSFPRPKRGQYRTKGIINVTRNKGDDSSPLMTWKQNRDKNLFFARIEDVR